MIGTFHRIMEIAARPTPFAIFGCTQERRTERRLIGQYEELMAELCAGLHLQNHAIAVQIAGLPEQMRGFGHVKERNIEKAKAREAALLAQFRTGDVAAAAE